MFKSKRVELFFKLGVMLFSLTLVMVLLLNLHNISGCNSEYDDSMRADYDNGERLYYIDGATYKLKSGIETELIIGIDSEGAIKSSGTYNNNAQADFLLLTVIDTEKKKYSLLHINRDTMTDVDILGLSGETVQTQYAQIALSHTYGDGLKTSCENTKKAVSNLLYGIEIDHYVSFTMSAVSELTDIVNGVEVTVKDDLTPVDPKLKKGATVKLNGKQALSFVRSRTGLSDSTNLNRISRQKQYLDSFINNLRNRTITNRFITTTYERVEEYTYFDSTLNQASTTLTSIISYEKDEVISPKGEAVLGDTFMEFYVDETDLKQIVIDLFLERVVD